MSARRRVWVPGRLAYLGALLLVAAAGKAEAPSSPSEVVGEAFGAPVTFGEFADAQRTATLLAQAGRLASRHETYVRGQAWAHLILLREAARLGIVIDRQAGELQRRRLVADLGGSIDGPSYAGWVLTVAGEDVERFERRAHDLARIEQLIRTQRAPIADVSEHEVRTELLETLTTLEIEYLRFETADEAFRFAAKFRRSPEIWKPQYDRQRSARGAEGAAWLGQVSLRDLVSRWSMPADDVRHLSTMQDGEVCVTRNLVGPIVARLLSKDEAADDEVGAPAKAACIELLMARKERDANETYVQHLVDRAAYRDDRPVQGARHEL